LNSAPAPHDAASANPLDAHVGLQHSPALQRPASRELDSQQELSLPTYVVFAGHAPASPKPDSPHVGWQHSVAWSHLSSQLCSSVRPRASAAAPHCFVPLASPLSRQPAVPGLEKGVTL